MLWPFFPSTFRCSTGTAHGPLSPRLKRQICNNHKSQWFCLFLYMSLKIGYASKWLFQSGKWWWIVINLPKIQSTLILSTHTFEIEELGGSRISGLCATGPSVNPWRTEKRCCWVMNTPRARSLKNDMLADMITQNGGSVGSVHYRCIYRQTSRFIMYHNVSHNGTGTGKHSPNGHSWHSDARHHDTCALTKDFYK